jgi:predicted amidohydrolase YtcJ
MKAGLNLLAAHGGDIITMDPARPRAQALLSLGGNLVAVGSDSEVRQVFEQLRGMRGVQAESPIDLAGRAVIPGLIDSHLHLLMYGFFLSEVDLNGVTSLGELKAKVADRAGRTAAGAWITGSGWQQDSLAEKRMPNRHDLDEVAPHHPVMLHRVCYHAVAANSLALKLAGISAATADPSGGAIDRDPATGEPTGILRENAVGLVAACVPAPTPEQALAALGAAHLRASAAGLTSVHTNESTGAVRAYLHLRNAGRQTVRAYIDTTLHPEDESALGLPAGLGDEWVRIGAVKLFADGSLGARTAYLRQPYADDPSARGLPIYPQAQLDEMVMRSHRAGRQVAIHAIGDAAMTMALDSIEGVLRAAPRPNHRHRIIHAQIVGPDIIERLRDLEVIADIQPKFVTGELEWAGARVGPEREAYSYCWRRMIESGVRCAGGSDCPVEPLEPLWGIYAAVTRSGMAGEMPGGWHPDQRLDVMTAIKLFTLDAAYAAFEETVKGSLEPGKLSDFVVLDRAPDKVDPHAIRDLKVEMTVAGGRVVYAR